MNSSTQFVSFFPDALLYLSRLNDAEVEHVFFALCKHVDALGYCDPGDERLGTLSGHRRDAIPAILERVQAIGYAHIILTAVPYRQKPLRGFQVSPYVLRLRIEHHGLAVTNWQRFNPQTNAGYEIQTTPITHGENDQQPESESKPESKPAFKPESQPDTQASLDDDRASKNNAEGVIRTKDPLKVEGQGQGQGQEQGEARTALESTSSASAVRGSAPPVALPPVWEPKTLSHYRRALADTNDENVALDMVSVAGDMSRENARMLVDTYGWDWCEWVMNLYRKESYSVEHPARWIRAMLRKTTTELRMRG